jgi:hypothetical protein
MLNYGHFQKKRDRKADRGFILVWPRQWLSSGQIMPWGEFLGGIIEGGVLLMEVAIFPRHCYILKETVKSYIVRPVWNKQDDFNEFTFVIPKKAITCFEIKGYSENRYEIRDISIWVWAKKLIDKQYWEQVEKQEIEEGVN